MNAAQLVLLGCGLLLAGALVSAVTAGNRRLVGALAFLFVLAAGACLFPAALSVLLGRPASTGLLLAVPTLGAQLRFSVDPLSAFFLLLISGISVFATLYSLGYLARYPEQHLSRYYPLLLLFLASIVAVVSTRDWFFFLVFWELMTVCSYFLVIFEREHPAAPRAGFKYLVLTHAATALLLIAVILVWNRAHSFSFDATAVVLRDLTAHSPALLHVLLGMWFIAFATKAGLLPFGDWLPDAYAAAPTSASAAFGGTMTKLAAYGLLRVFVDQLPPSDITRLWGLIIALFGAASMFIGTLRALAQSDAKRLMSWHVIGQMGYIVLALGAGIYLLPEHPALALVALLAGMFHLLNNVCYKSVLFMNAGSALLRVGERDLNRMSGLWSVMPLTGLTALIAAFAIAGVPPLNGFASKWLIYQVTLLGVPDMPVFVVLGIAAAFISLVTLASFLKFLGGAFLGRPSATPEQAAQGDVPWTMQLPQVLLAAACVLFGVFPGLALRGIFAALSPLPSLQGAGSLASLVGSSWLGMQLSFVPGQVTGVWLPVVGLLSLVVLVALAHGLSRLGAAERREVDLWNCGTLCPGDQTRYPAHSFYDAFKHAFRNVYPTVRPPRAAYPTRAMELFDLDRWLFRPALRTGERLMRGLSHTHSGLPQLYLSWQIAGLILVVIMLFLWAR